MEAVLCSDAIIKLCTVFFRAIVPRNDNITLISRPESNGFGQNHFFSLMFTVFDLSRPLEGRYGRCFVLGCNNQVVYGVWPRYSA